ncbi:FeoA family protein [Parvularcula oceani]|uniref:FeoA family protein n=1 Tax=Parvularcula oceani TaxID=1247963 RepID=UPI000690B37D|nr:FeoA family protein [Parvularcula oceani]
MSTLRPGESGRITAIEAQADLSQGLAEAGFSVGDEVEVLARGLFGGTPLSVRLGRAVVALRRNEAEAVRIS